MWLARHFPGLGITEPQLGEMTPGESKALFTAGKRLLKAEGDERWAHTKAIATVAGMRLRLK